MPSFEKTLPVPERMASFPESSAEARQFRVERELRSLRQEERARVLEGRRDLLKSKLRDKMRGSGFSGRLFKGTKNLALGLERFNVAVSKLPNGESGKRKGKSFKVREFDLLTGKMR